MSRKTEGAPPHRGGGDLAQIKRSSSGSEKRKRGKTSLLRGGGVPLLHRHMNPRTERGKKCLSCQRKTKKGSVPCLKKGRGKTSA